jgi:EAL domain-containing protein (putative c-di-GMP-specific phosphodiesterase class I)
MLHKLKGLGVRLAVDDFGTGYSTLSYLAHFPIDTLKIAQRFAPNILRDKNSAAVVAGIIGISRSLEMDVIAEGVETAEQLTFYRNKGCTAVQGWYYSRAMTVEALEQKIKTENQ